MAIYIDRLGPCVLGPELCGPIVPSGIGETAAGLCMQAVGYFAVEHAGGEHTGPRCPLLGWPDAKADGTIYNAEQAEKQ